MDFDENDPYPVVPVAGPIESKVSSFKVDKMLRILKMGIRLVGSDDSLTSFYVCTLQLLVEVVHVILSKLSRIPHPAQPVLSVEQSSLSFSTESKNSFGQKHRKKGKRKHFIVSLLAF